MTYIGMIRRPCLMRCEFIMIIKCTCRHEGQDAINGTGMRVANRRAKPIKDKTYEHRCTVCGSLHTKGV